MRKPNNRPPYSPHAKAPAISAKPAFFSKIASCLQPLRPAPYSSFSIPQSFPTYLNIRARSRLRAFSSRDPVSHSPRKRSHPPPHRQPPTPYAKDEHYGFVEHIVRLLLKPELLYAPEKEGKRSMKSSDQRVFISGSNGYPQ